MNIPQFAGGTYSPFMLPEPWGTALPLDMIVRAVQGNMQCASADLDREPTVLVVPVSAEEFCNSTVEEIQRGTGLTMMISPELGPREFGIS
jgi:hypothetical protein